MSKLIDLIFLLAMLALQFLCFVGGILIVLAFIENPSQMGWWVLTAVPVFAFIPAIGNFVAEIYWW